MLLFILSLLANAIPATLTAQQKSAWKVADLAWMSGSWATAPGREQIEEYWTKDAGGSMLGMGRRIAGGKTTYFEYLRIEARPDGIFYVAHPTARPGTDFKLTRLSANEALFENPQHDNPKKILYRKNPDGSLTARVDGMEKGKHVSEEVRFLPMK
ncbi:MAG TPA: DUF6265 family protein [Candidatus Acidoferrales bacterium]|jgi:hypothetical protein|nr:DUF6265 family protein [Candidatus Acidoferrales bacterium]